MLVHGSTLHAFTHNGDVDALQQETASIKTFCRLRITSFPTTILLVAHHRVKKVENCIDGADNSACNSLRSLHFDHQTPGHLASRSVSSCKLSMMWYLIGLLRQEQQARTRKGADVGSQSLMDHFVEQNGEHQLRPACGRIYTLHTSLTV